MSDENTNAPAEQATAPDPAQLQAEVARSRFEAAAVRAGLDDDFLDEVGTKASKWITDQKLEPTRDSFARFLEELKGKKPKLFASAPSAPAAPAPANTAPVSANAASAPAPAAVHTPYTQWRALVDAGDKAGAEAFYRRNRRAIARHA